MPEFKVGDRAAIYTYDGRYTGDICEVKDFALKINLDCDHPQLDFRWVHVKQCRKLKTKKRVVIWVPREEYPEHADNTGSRGLLAYLKKVPADNFKYMYTRIEYTESKSGG